MPKDNDGNEITLDTNSEEFKTALASAVETATAGLKKNRDEILAEKGEVKTAFDALKAQVDGLGDLEMVKTVISKFAEDSEAKLIAEGKIDEVLSKRTESMRLDAQTKVDAMTGKNTELTEALSTANRVIAEMKVGSLLDAAALKMECAGTANADIRRAGLGVFSVNENSHEVEARDAAGTLLLGPDAKSPLTPEAWLEQQKPISPHWWGPSAGGGAGGGRRGDPSLDPQKLEKMSARQLLNVGMQTR